MDKNAQDQAVDKAFTTSDFYQMLSVSLRPPTQELVAGLLEGRYNEDAHNILGELGIRDQEGDELIPAAESLSQLQQEYTRLFEDPRSPAIPIYETLMLRDQNNKEKIMMFQSPAALDAGQSYREAGFTLINPAFEPADHMATELEFMMYLYQRKGEDLKHKRKEELEHLIQSIEKFETRHLKKWAERFFDRLQSESQMSFYRSLARRAKAGLACIWKTK